ncbi:MAG: ABC transporter permease [Gammaproteobacteria bacterium]
MFALIWSNFRRNPGRKILTLLSLLIAFVLFGLLMALRHSLTFSGAGAGAAQILVTMNKAGTGMPMPVAYAERIAQIRGVSAVSYGTGTLGTYQKPSNAFLFLGVAGRQMFKVQPFLRISASQQQAWFDDRSGALVTPKLAQKFGWRIGERVPIETPLPQKDGKTTWYVTIDGIVTDPTSHAALGLQKMIVHYSYLDAARAAGAGTVLSFSERVADIHDLDKVGHAIDAMFTNASPETHTFPVNAVFRNIYGQIGNISLIVADVALAVFFSMLLIVGALLLHSARERLSEFAVLRALGFRAVTLNWIVFGEALLTCLIGGLLGLIVAWLVVGSFHSSLNQILSVMILTPEVWALGIGLMVLFAVLVSVLPALQLWRSSVRDALGRA